MPAVLALLASLMWGLSDFLAGLASRRAHVLQVAALSVPLGAVSLVVLAVVLPGRLTAQAVWLGAAAGVAGVGGLVLLYYVLAAGPMGVVSPLTAVVSAVVPVVVGLVIGERPGVLAYLGMLLTVVAIVLVSMEPRHDDDALHQRVVLRIVVLAVASGIFIGIYMAIIGLAPSDSGVWPVTVSRSVSGLLILAYALTRMGGAALPRAVLLPALLIGTMDSVANVFFRLAVQSGMLSVVSVLAALYPAATVLLARYYLHERLRPVQQLGMVTALGAAALLALG